MSDVFHVASKQHKTLSDNLCTVLPSWLCQRKLYHAIAFNTCVWTPPQLKYNDYVDDPNSYCHLLQESCKVGLLTLSQL